MWFSIPMDIKMKRCIIGRLVLLRQLQRHHFDPYLRMFSVQVKLALGVSSNDQELLYLQERLAKQQSGQTHFYSIFVVKADKQIGAIEIRDRCAHRGQLYYWLHEGYWGTGCLQEVVALVAQEYFMVTGSLFLNAYVDEFNRQSYYALKKCGFADIAQMSGPGRGKQYELVLRKR